MDTKQFIPAVFVLATFLVGIYAYDMLPERIITHWNATGKADGHSDKAFGLFIIPFVTVLLYLLMLVVPRIEVLEYRANIRKFYPHYIGLMTAFVMLMFALQLVLIFQNLGYSFNIMYFMVPAMAALFFYIGTLMPNFKRNYFIGIRVPWTLASEKVWNDTHKAGGRAFQIGALIMLLGLFFGEYAFLFFIVVLVLLVAFCFIYPYKEYKRLENAKKTSPRKRRV